MGAIPVVPVQDMIRMGFTRPMIDYFVRLRQIALDASNGVLTLPNGNSALYSDANGNIAEDTDVSPTELGYLNGVSSGIQTQLNNLGTQKLNVSGTGGSQYWNDIAFNFQISRTVGAGVPTWTDINSTGRFGWAITNEAVEANEKRLDWGIQAPHGVVANGDLRFHIHIYTGARVPAVDEYIRVALTYCCVPVGSVLSASTVTADLLIPSGTAAYSHVKLNAAGFNVSSTVAASADIGGTVRRKSSHANDTYEDTVYFVHGDPHALFDRGGTATEY